ncbi:hypothetical protein O5W18_002770 [Enterococcus hirae]|uniref:hypothetical protein n=1 Tax=Enterococcus hirae TaxID=1354 RepID=UPI000FFC9ED3|nr:hypothetical protein [Enterococcus hirae]EMF0100041.1 hypothetical protein [Enterococcus hirae]EMF0102981.1 hypothetical protein [Enterococcus hirae]EMF0283394.1 hypothetical protein [Enterococcus hirae]EMF0296179.1 hypothetical protein [Enterococcus hirae]EMF0511929.1 hypothetical protein [Enterococcus hirae]
MQETYSIKEILRKLEATEDGIWLIPNSDVTIVDERDLEEFELPESLETLKVICFWTTDEIRNYFSITNNKIVWFDNVLSEDATVFKGNIKEEIEIIIDEQTFQVKVLSDNILKYEDQNFYQDIGIDRDLEL